jgi:outer membrane protein TolC
MKNVILLLLIASSVYGQNVDYNKIILPEGVKTDDFAEKLVQLAWKNNPTNEILLRNINTARLDVKRSGVQWLDIFSAQGNLNEFTINREADVQNRAAFFTRYNFGARITFGMFFSIPYDVKKSREQVQIAEAQVNQQKLTLRSVVLKTYNEYQVKERIFKLYSQATLDAENSYKLMEQKFKQGETSFETYNASLNNFNRSSIAQLQSEVDYLNAKLDLESLIGVKIEEVR